MGKVTNTYDYQKITSFEPGLVHRYEWQNAAVFLHHQTKGHSGAYFTITIYGGSCTEKIPGTTHFLEHMLFKRKESLKSSTAKNDPVRIIETLGGELNAFTSKEYTCFELFSPASRILELIPHFLNIILHPNFTSELTQKEKKVIIQEIREDNEDYELFAKEILFQKVFHSPLSRPIAGSIRSVNSITHTYLKQYLNKNFIPSHMIFTLVGDLKTKKVVDLLDEQFKDKKLSKKDICVRPLTGTSFNNLKPFSFTQIHREVQLSCLIISLPGVCTNHPYLLEHYFLNSYLTEGMSSLLYQEFRHKHPILYGINGHVNSFKDSGNIEISLSCEEKQIKKIYYQLNKIIQELAINPIPMDEIQKVKRQMMDAWVLKFDDLEERNSHIYLNEMFKTLYYSKKRLEEKINRIDQERIFVVTRNIAKTGPSFITVTKSPVDLSK